MLLPLVLIITNLIAWFPTLNFWFFEGWEPGWLTGNCGGNHFTFLCIMQGHSLLYLIDYKLFGWQPLGWYATSLFLHTIVILLIYFFVKTLTKNKLFSFITAILFTMSIAYYDILTWGSFNSLYSLEMILFLLASFLYLFVRKTGTSAIFKKIAYLGILVLFALGLFVRESALLIPFLLLVEEFFIISQKSWDKKRMIKILMLFLPMAVMIILFLYIKSGLASYDQVDDSVRYSESLRSQKQYILYTERTLLTFGYLVAPLTIPYNYLNNARDFISMSFPTHGHIRIYFFSFVGLLYTLIQLIIIAKFWKKKEVRNMLLFAFSWYVIPEILACLVISFTNDSLLQAYNTSMPPRYRYFAFFGTVLFWMTVGQYVLLYLTKKFKKQKNKIFIAAAGIIALNLVVNFYFIRSIENQEYQTRYAPEKKFFASFLKQFKTLPKDYTFYVYPASDPLKDLISELYDVRQTYYPNLTEERVGFVEHQGGRILERLGNKTISLNNVFFLDYAPKTGQVINDTKEAREVLTHAPTEKYSINNIFQSNNIPNNLNIPLVPPLHVEIPYNITIVATSNVTNSNNPLDEKTKSLQAYATERNQLLQGIHISVCGTIPEGSRTEALQLLPENMIDGVVSERSRWWANCSPTSWIIYDFGKEQSIGGIAWAGTQGATLPSAYRVELSLDKIHWKKVYSVTNNMLVERIDEFSQVSQARYMRVIIVQTTRGAFPSFKELEPLGKEGLKIIKSYNNNFEQLLQDVYTSGGQFMHLVWATNPNNFDPEETEGDNSIYIPLMVDGQEHTYQAKINETEDFSAPGQFLKRTITGVHISFVGTNFTNNVNSVELAPRFTIEN